MQSGVTACPAGSVLPRLLPARIYLGAGVNSPALETNYMETKIKTEADLPVLQPQVAVGEVDELDIEEFSKVHGGKPPKARKYVIRIDREKFKVSVSQMTGRELLLLASKSPPENWLLNQKLRGGQVIAIGLTTVVDFTAPGVERFMTLPKDQTEGRPALRRQFLLPEADVEGLNASGLEWETLGGRNTGWLLVHGFALPSGYNLPAASAALQVLGGYPTTPLDMVYFHPGLSRADGRPIPCADAYVPIDGRQWQRWSRHYTAAHPWIPGEYSVVTHLSLVRSWLEREFTRC